MGRNPPPRPLRRQIPARRPRHRTASPQRRRIGWRSRIVLAAAMAIFALFAWAAIARHFAPASNTSLSRFDAIIVLGSPADSDGNPTPEQLARVTEAVREYERDVAPRLILTGGAAHNHFVEARVMARAAEAQGIPVSAIYLEPEAKDTIENACFAARIMKANGWRSAEVVSNAAHLPRAGMIFNRTPLEWRAQAAPPLEPASPAISGAAWMLETMKTMRYLAYGEWAERCEP